MTISVRRVKLQLLKVWNEDMFTINQLRTLKYRGSGLREATYKLRSMVRGTKAVNLDIKSMNALLCALNKEKFNRVSIATSAH